jgi:hypothetical protein
MDHREIGWEGMDWIDLAQDRGQWRGSCDGAEPSGSIKGGGISLLAERQSVSQRGLLHGVRLFNWPA